MLRIFMALGLAFGIFAPTLAQAAGQTIRVLVMQEDDDPESVERDTRIQRAVLSAFNQTLSAPASADIFSKYGIEGMDVYNEKVLTMPFDTQNRTRRQDTELISVARDIRNPRLDVLVLYTLYAKAIRAPFADYVKLQMSMNYRALDIRSGRELGGDNLDLDADGTPLTGCAAGIGEQKTPDKHCVKEFVAGKAERLVRDAGHTLSLQLAALSRKLGDRPVDDAAGGRAGGSDCDTAPRSYLVAFRGLNAHEMRLIVKRMKDWSCAVDVDLEDSSVSEASYSYKVRANDAQLKRNIEVTMERMGLEGGVELRGNNELLVKAIPLRSN